MGRTIIEDDSYKDSLVQLDKIQMLLDPEIEPLPEKDKLYYHSDIYLLINKESALSNLPPSHLWSKILKARLIFKYKYHPMLINEEYRRRCIAEYLNALKLPLSENALALLFGPLSHNVQHVKQELVQRSNQVQAVE